MSLITDGFATDLEQITNLVSRASKRMDGLSGMVNELLLVAQDRFEALEPKLEEVNLLDALESTVQLHEAEAISKDITVNLDADPEPRPVRATLDNIERVFSNLLSNAIKYTPRGGRIAMSLRDVDHRYLLFRISDTGIGIPKEAQAHIFEEFYRAPNARKLDEIGTGLGLAITRRFIEHFGGRLVFESEEGKGTTFSFFLPTATTPARATPSILRELGWAR